MQYNFITHQEIKKPVHALVNNSINKNSSSIVVVVVVVDVVEVVVKNMLLFVSN